MLFALTAAITVSIGAQGPEILWTETIGGSKSDIGFTGQQTSDGGYMKLMMDLNLCIREGIAEETTATIKDVTGIDPITFEQFVYTNKNAWL